ncbi:MAG: fumarylacetoacetate hydrolase family protein [Chloroflexota bacterium]
MILLIFKTESGLRLGVKTPDGVVDVQAAVGNQPVPTSLDALFAGGTAALKTLSDFISQLPTSNQTWLLNEADLTLAPCVPAPGKIICVGLNYRRHAAETGAEEPTSPVLFSKFSNALAAPNEAIPVPATAKNVDYEAELAVVIGRKAQNVAESDALNYVFGYCNADDISARDLQRRTSQWLLGKTLDKFLPLGPYLVTADTIPDPQKLTVRCTVNGEQRQNSSTGDMIFTVAQVISYISQHFTLEPGDVISTGTPEGVIAGMKEKVWLKAGDKIMVEVEGLGQLTNVIA